MEEAGDFAGLFCYAFIPSSTTRSQIVFGNASVRSSGTGSQMQFRNQ